MGSARDLAATADDLLRRHGLATRRSFGQNFLVRRSVLIHEVRELDAEDRTVLEVGTGFGFLTRELAAVARQVTTLEKDRGIARVAREELADLDNVDVIEVGELLT
ncbi:MAG: rRNA adenine N-6-methyltransferase family protein, partial [Methanopyri archaeon]|nr:rRNA adenine N-6-methyltransferase family protein [Methanopyri archaeon]